MEGVRSAAEAMRVIQDFGRRHRISNVVMGKAGGIDHRRLGKRSKTQEPKQDRSIQPLVQLANRILADPDGVLREVRGNIPSRPLERDEITRC